MIERLVKTLAASTLEPVLQLVFNALSDTDRAKFSDRTIRWQDRGRDGTRQITVSIHRERVSCSLQSSSAVQSSFCGQSEGESASEADLDIQASPLALVRALARGRDRALPNWPDDIKVRGDLDLARALLTATPRFAADLLPILHRVLGPELASYLYLGTQATARAGADVMSALESKIVGALQARAVGAQELDEFARRVDDLRLRFDRMQARVEAYARRVEPARTSTQTTP